MIYEISKPKKYVDSFLLHKENDIFLFEENGKYYLATNKTEQEALAALEAHNPPALTEPTVQEKLASVGLSVDDLKTALGIQNNL